MSEKIKSSDIFEGDIFKIVVDSAELAKTKIAELNKELVEVGTSFKKELNGIKADNVKEIEALIVKVKELTKAVDAQTQVNKANEIAIREAKKTSEQALREEEKTKRDVLKTQEQINKSNERAVKNQKDLSDAYKQLAQNTRDLKNESKRLGAEMIELEKQGKKNSAEYYKLSRQYKETTKSAIEGDKALKKLDSTVGDNFRNVGNYSKAIGGLKNALMQLGLAFGVFDGIRALLDTQIKLDSLNLSLKNVSSSTKEYQANFAFLKDLSLSYGQDLLVLIDSYKNFIASTSSSNLSLTERKRIYESVIKAGSALALSNDNIKGSLLAISQMFSKGTVSAEELRQQLGERLPGAFGIMAESMGVTEAELGKLMKEGKVLADDVMPRFAILLERSFGENAKARLQTFGGAWNVLKNNVTLYFDQAQKSVGVNKVLAGVILGLGKNIGEIINNIRQLIIAFVSFKALLIANEIRLKGLSVGFLNMAKNALTGANAVKIFGLSLKNIAFLAVIDGIVKMTERFLDLSKGIDIAKRSYDIYLSTTNKGNKKATDFLVKVNDEYLNEQEKLAKKKKDGLISQAEFNKKMDEAELERVTKIQKRIRELEVSISIGKKSTKDIRNLFGGKSPVELAKQAREDRGFIANLLNTIGIETKSGDLLDKEFFAKLYQKEKGNINDFYTQLEKLRSSLSDDTILKTKYSGGKGSTNKDILNRTIEVRDLNIQYNQTNEYLSRQLEILKDIDRLNAENKLQETIDKTTSVLTSQEKTVNMTGKYNAGLVEIAVNEEYEARKKFEEKRFEAEKEDKKIQDEKLLKDELDSIKEQEDKFLQQYLEVKSDTERKIGDLEINLKKKNLSTASKQRLGEEKKNLEAQLKQNEVYLKKIEDGATEQRNIVLDNKLKREADTNLEIEKLQIIHEGNLANIQRDSQTKLQDELDKLELIRAEKRLEMIKNTAESVNNLIQKSLEHYINMAERRIDMLDKRMDRMSTQADFLREKAVAGNIQAQESLAVIDKQEIEAQKERMNEQRSIQKLQMAMAVFQAYSNNIQNAKVGENPFTKTLTDVTLLSQFINSLPTFIDGTETNIASALGKPHLQGQDGYLVRVDGSEKVLNPQLSAMTGNMTTMEIAKLAEDFRRGDIMRKGEGAMQLNVGSWGTDMIISELQDLKNVIKNKPENQVEVAEILNGVMHIVETKKSGNTKVRNISRFS
jgi:tape measure domain-containing protein